MKQNLYCVNQRTTNETFRKNWDSILWHPRGELLPPPKTFKDKSKYTRKRKHRNENPD